MFDQAMTNGDELAPLSRTREAADGGAGATRDGQAFPVRLRSGARAAQDFNRIAVFEDGTQRALLPVDTRANSRIADLRVDGIGEIERRCAGRQTNQLAFRGEHENAVAIHLQLGVFEEFLGA